MASSTRWVVPGLLAASSWLFVLAFGDGSYSLADHASLLQADLRVARGPEPKSGAEGAERKSLAPASEPCASALSAAPSASERLELLKPVFWLHIPKTGDSWLNVLLANKGLCPLMPDDAYPSDSDAAGNIVFNLLPTYCPGGMSEHISWHVALGAIYPDVKGHIVGLFRQPEQRIISHYYMGVDNGLLNPESTSVLDYAKDTAGLQFQYLLAQTKETIGEAPPSPANVALAKQRIREGFAFVGLTDEWDLSVCLFHAKFGSECQALEFSNIHAGSMANSSTLYDTSELHGWVDAIDSDIFEQASQIFMGDMVRFGVNSLSCARWCSPGSALADRK